MDELHTKLWLALVLSCLATTEGRCKFPKDWKGRWYQGGLGEVTIRSNTISTKGYCVENNNNGFYLVENRDRNCFTCLLIMKQHRNILQYKESFCLDKDSIDKICSQIRVETPLYTLVREPHVPATCPFQDAYYFDYNDNLYGFCDNKISYAKPCAGDYKFRFHFKHCMDIAYLNGQDMDFECVATWKDGSDMYLYGKFSGPSILDRDESYRCFKYQSYGHEVYAAMSADTTCRGLRTPRDGPVVMEFRKDINGFPPPTCDIPDWLIDQSEWRDMDSKHVVHVDTDKQSIIVSHRKRPNKKEHIKYELRCVETLEKDDSKKYLKMVSFSSHSCTSKHQCVVIEEKAPNLVEVKLGKLLDHEEARKCKKSDFEETMYIIPSGLDGIKCPFSGRHRVLYGSVNCPGDVVSGCNHTSQIDMKCNTDIQVLPYIKCVSQWKADNTTYVIVKEPSEIEEGPVGCVSFKENKQHLEFSTECKYKDVPNIFQTPLSLTLHIPPMKCEDYKPEPPPRKPKPKVKEEKDRQKEKGQKEEKEKEKQPTESVELDKEDGIVDFANAHEGQYQHVDEESPYETISEKPDDQFLPKSDQERSQEQSETEPKQEDEAPHEANSASHHTYTLITNIVLTLIPSYILVVCCR